MTTLARDRLLSTIEEPLGLSKTELGRLFGVTRQAIDGWHEQGVPAARGSFPVVYLCESLAVARANVFRTLTGLRYEPEDLESERGPVLVEAEVPEDPYVDAVTRRGLESLGLPSPAAFGRSARSRSSGG